MSLVPIGVAQRGDARCAVSVLQLPWPCRSSQGGSWTHHQSPQHCESCCRQLGLPLNQGKVDGEHRKHLSPITSPTF